MSSEQLRSESRASQESQEAPNNRDNLDVCLTGHQQKLDHQRELLEKRQRRKRLDPMMAQPVSVPGLPLAKQRSEENQFHLRSSCPPTTNFILPGAVDPVATTRPNDQDSVPELPPIPVNSSAGTSTATDVAGSHHKDMVPKTPTQLLESVTAVHDIDGHVEEHLPVKLNYAVGAETKDWDRKLPVSSSDSFTPVEKIETLDIKSRSPKLASKIYHKDDAIGADKKDWDLKLHVSSSDSLISVEKIETLNIKSRSPKLASKKIYHKKDAVGAESKDWDQKLPVSSSDSLTPVEKIESLDIKPCSPKLASKKIYHKDAHMIIESEKEAKKYQESVEAILKKHVPLFKLKKSHDDTNFNSDMSSMESFDTAVPEITELLASLSNLKDFAYCQAPQNDTVRCQIMKDIKKGSIFSGFYMFVELRENKEIFVLAARKYKRFMRSEYIISTDYMDLCLGRSNYIGRLRANLMKTKYTLYNNSMDPNQCRDSTEKCSTQQKLGTIIYKNKPLGFRRPKSMTVIIPSSTGSEEQVPVESTSTLRNFFSKWRKKTTDNVFQLQNKNPIGKLEIQKSQKNLELIQGSEPSRVVMELQHDIKNRFMMEYSYPLSTVQAFAIALSRIDRG